MNVKGRFTVNKQQPKFHKWFHGFLIYFALWAFPLFGVAYGVYYIDFAQENAVRYMPLVIILAVLLILVSLFTIKVRFDLAAFRPAAPKLLVLLPRPDQHLAALRLAMLPTFIAGFSRKP